MTHTVPLMFRQSPERITLVSCSSAPTAPAASEPPASVNVDQPSEADRLAEQLEFLRQLLNEVGLAIEGLQQQHRETITEMQQAAVELSVAAASWIVGAAIDANMFAVDDLVGKMVNELHREQPIKVFLNPEDAQLLNGLRDSSDAEHFAAADVEFIADGQLGRGIVRAESTRSTLVTDMDERLADIRRIWLENLNETQTERRADDPDGRRFRRFPERRHPA